MPANLENSAVVTELENISFHSNPKERHSQGMFIAVVSYASKVMLKILQARLQEYVQTGFAKDRGMRDQMSDIHCIIEKAREFHRNIYCFFIDYTNVFDCVDHNKLWKILQEMGIPQHLN